MQDQLGVVKVLWLTPGGWVGTNVRGEERGEKNRWGLYTLAPRLPSHSRGCVCFNIKKVKHPLLNVSIPFPQWLSFARCISHAQDTVKMGHLTLFPTYFPFKIILRKQLPLKAYRQSSASWEVRQGKAGLYYANCTRINCARSLSKR